MRELPNGGRVVEDQSELPRFDKIDVLYADFETTSCDDKKDALNPWHHCWVAGIAVTVDDARGSWYVPVRHRYGNNLPIEPVIDWWCDLLSRAKVWCNHNVKYDQHVSANDFGVIADGELRCTVVHSKLLDSDRAFKGGYGLDALAKAWLCEDITSYENAITAARGRSQDFGVIPVDIMAPYACQDAMTTRRLDHYIRSRMPSECENIARIETELTKILFEMERTGVCVNPTELQLRELEISVRLIELAQSITTHVGRNINPMSSEDMFDLLCNQYGLPVLGWTDEDDDGNPRGNPSFDKEAMAKYLVHPHAPRDVLEMIIEYKQLSTLNNLFVKKYQQLVTSDNRLHPSHNQCVRTGRMACSDPNLQQLDKRAKELIHPGDGKAFLSYDQSQIEFRVIVHYIRDERCIAAYNANPDTDFHQWVAEMSGMKRKPAKTMNFMMGYGGGKKKAVRVLSMNADVIGDLQEQAKGDKALFDLLCKSKAEKVYDDYHMTLPTLKSTARRAAAVCADRGYIFNMHGRRRHLQREFAHKAFNSLCQGEAADIQKERTVACARALRGTPITMNANVHDATLFEGPIEVMRDPKVQHALAYVLEHTDVPLRVPLRVAMGYSERSWREADETAVAVQYDASTIRADDPLHFLR